MLFPFMKSGKRNSKHVKIIIRNLNALTEKEFVRVVELASLF
jgi:hypothetical protein